MANMHRGEISAELDGKKWTLCLTLGALAELEDTFGVSDIGQLAHRFSSGKLSASHILSIIGAGLRGGGHTISDHEVGEMRVDNGLTGYVEITAELLKATFGIVDENPLSDQGTEFANPL